MQATLRGRGPPANCTRGVNSPEVTGAGMLRTFSRKLRVAHVHTCSGFSTPGCTGSPVPGPVTQPLLGPRRVPQAAGGDTGDPNMGTPCLPQALAPAPGVRTRPRFGSIRPCPLACPEALERSRPRDTWTRGGQEGSRHCWETGQHPMCRVPSGEGERGVVCREARRSPCQGPVVRCLLGGQQAALWLGGTPLAGKAVGGPARVWAENKAWGSPSPGRRGHQRHSLTRPPQEVALVSGRGPQAAQGHFSSRVLGLTPHPACSKA